MTKNYWQSKETGTGPKSDTGKEISSRNATKHGCCSTEILVLATESRDDFKALESAWFRAYEPTNTAEVHLVHQLTEADWLLQRSSRTVADVEAKLFAQEADPLKWTDAHQKTLSRFLRYQTARTNLVAKRQKAVEDFRKNRAAEVTRAQAANDKAEKLSILKSRLKTHQEKNQPIPDFGEHLEQMRQKAIALGFTPPPRP